MAAASALVGPLPLPAIAAKKEIRILSPNRQVALRIFLDSDETLNYEVTFRSRPVIERSALGIVVDGVNLAHHASFGKIVRYSLNEKYATLGVHSEAVNLCNGTSLELNHQPSRTKYAIQARVFNGGLGFRFLVLGSGARVPDEATSFKLPAGSVVWFHDFEGHYEGIHQKKEIVAVRNGEWAAPPLTIKLSSQAGYAAITEAALVDYAGMGLQADGDRGFAAVLGHALPVSHPFDLRYGKDEARRLSQPASINGLITTPWRVIMIGADLNDLVNSDILGNLSSRADRNLFPQDLKTNWLRPGRAVWRYLDGGENTFDEIKEFSRLAGLLGFEHQVVEGLWHRWSEDQIRELVSFSKERSVGLWFWEHSKNLRTPQARVEFFGRLQRLGVVGAKIDFFDHEAKEIIDLYQALLRTSAERRIMIEFHGANKPTGESRTWPNEMSREAIRGLEYRSMETRAVHNTTLPFTRFLAGPADYTPVIFSDRRKETSWAHQIATAVVFTSPLMTYGAHPQSILDNPAVELIKSLPSSWDQTVVLAPSEVGELALYSRRRGDTWFLGILNGPAARTLRVSLSFLGRGAYQALQAKDNLENPAALVIETTKVSRTDRLTIAMRAGGGFVGRFKPVQA